MRCPACQSDVAGNQRFCGQCGATLPELSEFPTVEGSDPLAAPAAQWPERPASEPSRGFTPGTVLAGRYRIVGLLGRGGMGEVYRADDLKLGTPVALKFLPRALVGDLDRGERFLSEVRLARQIAHPNVCRVFDVNETLPSGGERFLTMEYVDGEDLASLLRRIGRLPPDKGLDIARQLCAGLAAAHERGVLHRDLKPANVMLDGHGRVRIMDFGLAVAADARDRDLDRSGTPAYMAPEQLAGAPATMQSDIYALGLVLYEIYTGKLPFATALSAELRPRTDDERPRPPSDLVADIDPAVERVLLRALARDPQLRPPTVTHVAAALPGGNLLEAVLRAGQTPSPEMVAASGDREGLTPATAWALLLLAAMGAITAIALGPKGLLWRHATPERSPDALADHARELLTTLGHSDRSASRASGFEVDLPEVLYLEKRDPVGWRLSIPEPSFLRFWYRASPRPLEAWRFPFLYGNLSRITPSDPPLDLAGMTLVRTDPAGRLTDLVVVPVASAGQVQSLTPDWSRLLQSAGFDPSAWRPSAPTRNPPVFADTRMAWEGSWPSSPDLPMRLEAAALDGKPVYFEAVFPWTPPPRTPAPLFTPGQQGVLVAAIMTLAAIVVGVAILAQRNVRAGRGDRRGAARLSAFVFAAMFVSWFFGESHVPTLWETALVVMALSWAILAATFSWVAYLAVEPFLRRRWPEVLVTWTRLLGGDVRDPLVGRDVLIGCAAGSLLAIVAIGAFIVPSKPGAGSTLAFVDIYGFVYRVQAVVPFLLWRAAQAVLAGLAGVFALLVLRLALRSQWAAVGVFVLPAAVLNVVASGDYGVGPATTTIHFAVFALLIVRFGLLAAVVQFYVWGLFIFFPMTFDLSAWYGGAGLTGILILVAITLFGFTTALAGRPGAGRIARQLTNAS
jgi:serine/threonine-protein kinase